jgi:hypothetical protein
MPGPEVCGKASGRRYLCTAQESHGSQARMRYHTPDALALGAARSNHELLSVVSTIHHSCPLRLIQVGIGHLPPTELLSTQSIKWNNGGRDCADGLMIQGSCFTGLVGMMTRLSLKARGWSRDRRLATRLPNPTSVSRYPGCLSVSVTFIGTNRALSH